MSRRDNKSIPGQFVPHRFDLLMSPSWRFRPMPLARILERLEIEHMRHGGAANGQLYVSYGQFVQEGVSRKSVAKALQLGQTLGLLEVMPHSGVMRGNIRDPNAYRLTYLATSRKPPTDEWRLVTETKAKQLVQQFRGAVAGRKEP